MHSLHPLLAQQPLSARAEPELTALVRAAQAGDQHAWLALIRRFESMIAGIARGFRLSDSDADDAAQNTWLRLLVNLPSLHDPAALPGWLSTTTRRECLRVLQHNLRETVVDEVRRDGEEPSVEVVFAAAETRRIVRAAVATLPERQRDVIQAVLSDEQRSYSEIAEALDIPRGSVGPTRKRSIERLRRDPQLTQFCHSA